MSYLKEKVSYLKGLADGMQISDATNEGKLLKAIIEVLDDVALSVDDIEEIQDQLGEQVDTIDEDLADVEKVLFGDDCDEEDDEDEENMMFKEIDCPHCGEVIDIDADMIGEDGATIECPNCHKKVELEWECGCGECDGHDHE
jgi:predicted Zn finger-like uncharacterized protein